MSQRQETLGRWDTCDAAGVRVPGGMYLVRLSAGAQTRTRKVVVLR